MEESIIEEQETAIESLVGHMENYTATTIELAKLKSTLKAADMLSVIAVAGILFFALLLTILLISIAGAIWVGTLIGSPYGGFLIVAGFYTVAGLLIYRMRERLIKTPVSNRIIHYLFDQ